MSGLESTPATPAATAQDLSFADQQELLAFIEKRNWFEQKLDSLKGLAPVYPFVHPFLVSDPKSTAGYVRAGADTSPYRLPDRAQLAAWVSERNALEDEVDRFDDGDMERMKERTRQMTRVPLTQPSTDLVEVTLDLILLIDQLLTVLRKRGAVLELASLRLQWDDLRHEVSRESESVHAEIHHVVSEAQAWIPGAPSERMERRSSGRVVSRPSLQSSSSTGSLTETAVTPTTSTSAPIPLTPTTPPTSPSKQLSRRSPQSPSKSTGGPKSSLHLSILRSQLVGLQSRQRNYTITLVKRSSAILDKMIDAAGRLDGLGGITGPLEESDTVTGAVPEELIELQDAIDENATAMNDIVRWCSEFENQCRQAHQHYMASLQAQHSAGEFLLELEKALTSPASNAQHAILVKQYTEATRSLPAVLDAKFPRPSHPDYPSKDAHNEKVVEALQAARDSAQADIDLAGKGLAFYSGMVKAREALLAQHQRVQSLRTQLAHTVERLERGTASVPRPVLEDVARSGGDCSRWLSAAADWITTGDEVVRSATDTHQSTTLAAMQYRKALVSASMAVKKYFPAGGVPDDLGPVVDDDTGDLLALAGRCAQLTKTTRTASEALPLVLCLRQDSDEVADDVEELNDSIVLAINHAAWSSRRSDLPPPLLDVDMAKLSAKVADMEGDLQRLRNITPSTAVSQPLADKVAEVRSKITAAKSTLATFERVSEQAKVVLAVQTEADALLGDIDAARESIPGTKDTSDITSLVNAVRQRVAAWNDSLTQRVVFVSDNPPSLERSGSRECSEGPLTPPLTPVDEFSTEGTTMPDLLSLDGRVRSELNRQSARVSSALGHFVSTSEEVAVERWSAPVVKATSEVETATAKLSSVMAALATRMEQVKAAEGEERKTVAAEAQKAAREALPEPVIELQQCIAALNEALGGTTTPGVDMHRAADVFSSADVAREAGLACIGDSEEWQKEVSRLSLEAEVKLQKEKAALLRKKAQAPQTRSSSTTIDKASDRAKELAQKLDSLDLENIVRPSPIALRATPKHRRLPSSAVAKQLSTSFASINASARSLVNETTTPKTPEVDTLLSKLKRAATLVPELGGLGSIADASTTCDRAFSALVDAIDSNDKEKIRSAERDAEQAVTSFRKAAKLHKLDERVMNEQKRIIRAWDDLRDVADDEPLKSSTSTTSSIRSTSSTSRSSFLSRSSTSGSLSSLLSEVTIKNAPTSKATSKAKKSTRPVPSKLTTSTDRSVSMLPPPPKTLPKKQSAPEITRSRVASISDTPSKPPKAQSQPAPIQTPIVKRPIEKRASNESVKATPRTGSRSSVSSRTPSVVSRTPSGTPRFKPTVPQPFSFTTGGLTRSASATTSLSALSDMAATPTRLRGPRLSAPAQSPSLTRKSSTKRLTQATKLDEAVAQVLDTLDVDVPVVPLGRDSPEQWHDESGRYWIGTGGKARLCFCRILRSRTVMVRVGGGWVELSRYLLDRFSDELTEQVEHTPTRETMSLSPPDWRRVPLAITSATLNATQSLTTTMRSDGSLPPRTPVRKPLPFFDNAVSPIEIVTPEKQSTLSPSSQQGSPLVPIQFIRKASESPSVREREREKLRGRPPLRETSLSLSPQL